MENLLQRHLMKANPRANFMPSFFRTGDEEQRLALFYVDVEPFKARYFAYTRELGAVTIGGRTDVQAFLGKCYGYENYGYEEQLANSSLTVAQHIAAEDKGLALVGEMKEEARAEEPVLDLKSLSEGLSNLVTCIDSRGGVARLYATLQKEERRRLKLTLRLSHTVVSTLQGMTPIDFEDEHLDSLGLDDKT